MIIKETLTALHNLTYLKVKIIKFLFYLPHPEKMSLSNSTKERLKILRLRKASLEDEVSQS